MGKIIDPSDYGFDDMFTIPEGFKYDDMDGVEDFEPIFDQDGAGFEEICELTHNKICAKLEGARD